jgi:hypothetical protein
MVPPCYTFLRCPTNNPKAQRSTRPSQILTLNIPPADHGTLESRLEALMNDPDEDADDVIAILRSEFDPEAEG